MPRPKFKPTEEQRRKVKALAAGGVPQDEICSYLGLRSPKTLRKCLQRELSHGLAHATSIVAGTAFEMAISGDYPAIDLLLAQVQRPVPRYARRARGKDHEASSSDLQRTEAKQGGGTRCRGINFNPPKSSACE